MQTAQIKFRLEMDALINEDLSEGNIINYNFQLNWLGYWFEPNK